MNTLEYPSGKSFAFSIFDDTDVATLDSIRPLYDYMYELGLLTTKSVWSLDYSGKSDYQGSHTLENPAYAEYMRELQKRGFEIGFHGATMESALRDDIEKALLAYTNTFGTPPSIYAAHSYNRDNLYWGESRFSFSLLRWLYKKMSGEQAAYFQGHEANSPYFWGDLAQQHIKYMRSFTFTGINLLSQKLPLVYRKPDTEWVNNWFISCDAENVEEFNTLLTSKNQTQLEAEKGICIISTHLGKGFVDKGKVHQKTKMLLKELSARNGWFVPTSTILDFYVAEKGCPILRGPSNMLLETKWYADSFKRRLQRKAYHATETQYLNS